jgi:hypothetical protein
MQKCASYFRQIKTYSNCRLCKTYAGFYKLEHMIILLPTVLCYESTTVPEALNKYNTHCSLVGKHNCTWSSCSEGCTKEIFTCWQVSSVGGRRSHKILRLFVCTNSIIVSIFQHQQKDNVLLYFSVVYLRT